MAFTHYPSTAFRGHEEHHRLYPDSIAGRYAAEYVEGPQTKDNFRLTRQYGATAPVDWRLLSRITTDVCDNASTKSDAVVQVRLGDALCGTNKDMLQKRPPAPQ